MTFSNDYNMHLFSRFLEIPIFQSWKIKTDFQTSEKIDKKR